MDLCVTQDVALGFTDLHLLNTTNDFQIDLLYFVNSRMRGSSTRGKEIAPRSAQGVLIGLDPLVSINPLCQRIICNH